MAVENPYLVKCKSNGQLSALKNEDIKHNPYGIICRRKDIK